MGFFSKLFGRKDEADVQDYTSQFPDNSIDFAAANAVCCPVDANACFAISDVFVISGMGTVVTGMVTRGSFSVGDRVTILNGNSIEAEIAGIEQFRKKLDTINENDNAGLVLKDITRKQVCSGNLIIK